MAIVDSLARTEHRLSARPRPSVSGMAALIDNRYRVLGRLAQGGMGIIYRAEDVLLQRPAALKVVDPSLAHSEETLELFRREARALARLRHDNVVQIYAFGAAGPLHFFAMELIDGRNLDDILLEHLEAGRSMPLDLVVEIVQKVASGLTAAHARSVTHRDVKPANIVLEHESGRPVLVDFGIARHAKDTHSNSLSGTPTYMAPEQIRNEPDHDGARADLYSLACTAFEMLVGQAPFAGATPDELMLAHMDLPPPLLSSFHPEYEPLDGVFARALAKNPKYRPESCVAFARQLAEAAKDVSRPSAVIERALEIQLDDDEADDEDEERREGTVIVLAEDDGMRRLLVREATRSLRKAGIETPGIACAGTTAALLAEVQRRRPAMVILDDDAVGGASVELARSIRRLEGGDRTHIVVLSRDMLAERSVWQAIDARRLSKPLSVRALASTLDELVLARR